MLKFSTKRTGAGLVRFLNDTHILDAAIANALTTATLVRYLRANAGLRQKTDPAVIRWWRWSEELGTLELLLEIFGQSVEPCANILRRQLLRLAGLGPLALLAHGGRCSIPASGPVLPGGAAVQVKQCAAKCNVPLVCYM
jgi:hypothetical protein